MKGQFVASIDQGTTGTRCAIYDSSGKAIGWSYKRHTQIYPNEGWVEHDPLEILKNTKFVMADALDKSGLERSEIDSVGLTNQRETVVAWNRETGIPFHNAIVWQDSRTGDLTAKLKAEQDEAFVRQKSGVFISPYFSATKIKWLTEHSDKFKNSIGTGDAMVGTIDSWLMWNLTEGKEFATDYTNASRTMLMDIRSLNWDYDLMNFFGLDEIPLPEIKTSMNTDGFGEIRGGKFDGISIMSALGDQQAALVGERCLNEGDTKITYGTGSFVLQNTGNSVDEKSKSLIATCAYGDKDGNCVYAIEGSNDVAGSVFDWLESIGILGTFDDIETALKEVHNTQLYMVPAFNGLLSPHWDETARGIIIGLTNKTSRHDILRAASEAICFQVGDIINAMPFVSGTLKVDGGPSVNNSLMQLQADILGRELHRYGITEATAFGAALASGISSGLWTEADIMNLKGETKIFRPVMDEEDRGRKYKEWSKAVERARNWSVSQ